VEFRILGPLEVVEDGEPLALGTLKERLVLGVLLLHANEFVSRDHLIDDLWGEAPPPTARQAVSVYVSKVRKTLSGAGDDPITTAPGGYRLNVESDRLDESRMQALVADAQELVARGELVAAAERFQEALSFWRGPTLAGLQFESRGRDEVAALDEVRLAVLMDRIDCDLALGRHQQAVGELGVLVPEHPMRERLRAQQMLALYGADRQADALQAYAEARRTLVDDLGIEPSEALQRLQQAILRHDPSLETPEGTAAVNGVPTREPEPTLTPVPEAEEDGGARRRYRPSRWQLALAALVILSGSAAAAAVLSSPADSTPQVVPDSLVRINPQTRKIVSVTQLDGEPEQIAVTPKAIWTANFTAGSFSRYNLRTGKVASAGAPGGAFNLAADAAGNVWVSGYSSPTKIEHYVFGPGGTGNGPLTPTHTNSIRVPKPGAEALALGSGYLWAISGPRTAKVNDLVSLIDPSTNKTVRHWNIGHDTSSIAVGGGAAWVGGYGCGCLTGSGVARWAGSSTLTVIRPTTHRPRSYRLEHPDLMAPTVAYSNGTVWALTCESCLHTKLLEFDPAKGRVVHTIVFGHQHPNALAVGAGSIWLTDQADAVLQLNPKRPHRIRTIPIGNPKNMAVCAIAATRNAVWVTVGNTYCGDTFNVP
jgi:DNA-binding SARP family transcriptional activator/streptogramin lyase